MILSLFIVSAVGAFLSAYALNVEENAGRKKGYEAACDINDELSCTKAFKSKYAKTLGISNSIYGVFFYALIMLLSASNESGYILVLSVLAIVGSIYLAYMQYARVKTLCLVCTAIYVINILLFVFSFRAAF